MTILSAEILIFISSHVFSYYFLHVFLLILLLSPQFIAGANGFHNNDQSLSMF